MVKLRVYPAALLVLCGLLYSLSLGALNANAEGSRSSENNASSVCPAQPQALHISPLSRRSNDQALIYTSGNSRTSRIIRYDATTGHSITLLTLPTAYYQRDIVLSDNGEYLLFIQDLGGRDALRAMRIDGKDVQTLYCAPAGAPLLSPKWSPDQTRVAFTQAEGYNYPVYLLNLLTGQLQTEIGGIPEITHTVRAWLDNRRIYIMTGNPHEDLDIDLRLLDLARGTHQSESDLSEVTPRDSYYWSASLNHIHTKLYTSTCLGGPASIIGPSTINVQPVTGGSQTQIFSTPEAITRVQALNDNTILLNIFYYKNGSFGGHNGLWRLDLPSKRLTQLVSLPANVFNDLRTIGMEHWTMFSPDSNRYVMTTSTNGTPAVNRIIVGNVRGGSTTIVESTSNRVTVSGWTRV